MPSATMYRFGRPMIPVEPTDPITGELKEPRTITRLPHYVPPHMVVTDIQGRFQRVDICDCLTGAPGEEPDWQLCPVHRRQYIALMGRGTWTRSEDGVLNWAPDTWWKHSTTKPERSESW